MSYRFRCLVVFFPFLALFPFATCVPAAPFPALACVSGWLTSLGALFISPASFTAVASCICTQKQPIMCKWALFQNAIDLCIDDAPWVTNTTVYLQIAERHWEALQASTRPSHCICACCFLAQISCCTDKSCTWDKQVSIWQEYTRAYIYLLLLCSFTQGAFGSDCDKAFPHVAICRIVLLIIQAWEPRLAEHVNLCVPGDLKIGARSGSNVQECLIFSTLTSIVFFTSYVGHQNQKANSLHERGITSEREKSCGGTKEAHHAQWCFSSFADNWLAGCQWNSCPPGAQILCSRILSHRSSRLAFEKVIV